MPMQREPASDSTQATISAFLDAHYARELVNDVGPVLGRLASLCNAPRDETIEPRLMQDAISAALTGHAKDVRESG
jgi:hypothetical protein